MMSKEPIMNNDYPLRCWSMEQVAIRDSLFFAF